jgi:hypothetical protein
VAYDCLAHGWSVIPVDIQKRPILKRWRKWQTERPTRARVTQWMQYDRRTAGVAVICGDVSGGLVVLDFDDVPTYNAFVRHRPELAQSYTVKTSRGYHVYLYVDAPTPSEKRPNLDIQSNGKYVVGAGSHHASGESYEVFADLPVKRVPELDELLPSVATTQAPQAPRIARSGNSSQRAQIPTNGNLESTITAELTARGWTQRGDWLNGCCVSPDHDDQNPSGGFNTTNGVYHCFVCGTPSKPLLTVAGWLGIDVPRGTPASPAPAAHPNLALKYPDRRAMPLLFVVDAWLTAGNPTTAPLADVAQFAQSHGWACDVQRLRYLVRHYGTAMHVSIDGDVIGMPSLTELSKRFIGRRGPGPAYTLPPDLDPTTRGGGTSARSWLFYADRKSKPTPSRYAMRRLGYKSHQTPITHARKSGINVIRGNRNELTAEEADALPYRVSYWRAERTHGIRRHFEDRADAVAWAGDALKALVAIVQHANTYIVQATCKLLECHRLDIIQSYMFLLPVQAPVIPPLRLPVPLKRAKPIPKRRKRPGRVRYGMRFEVSNL